MEPQHVGRKESDSPIVTVNNGRDNRERWSSQSSLTHSITTTLCKLEKTPGTSLPEHLFLKCRLNVTVHQQLMSILILRPIKTTRLSNVRGESRYAIAITNMLVNLANYLQFRPPDKLVR